MKINKDLENFLKQEKLTEVFKKEVNAQDCKWDEIEVESLITAMVWNKTSQGFEWWKSVNDTFEKYENTPDIIKLENIEVIKVNLLKELKFHIKFVFI